MQKGWMVYFAGSTETRHGGMHPPQIYLDQLLHPTRPQRLQDPDSHPRDWQAPRDGCNPETTRLLVSLLGMATRILYQEVPERTMGADPHDP